ncbi:peptidase S15 [Salinisphaera sp. T5B8]|uniref:CocE/NonD family hydrolase n=1 Tax=Salinisphaera sp. T5B8 TaxID=1304154 RepID=UPI00333E6ECB
MRSATLQARDYNAIVTNPDDGVEIAITVMQPDLAAGETAPLVLHGHGFGGARLNNRYERSVYEVLSGGILPSTEAARRAAASGYFVISFDQRGFGESGGKVEIMNPEVEGADISAILDWADNEMPERERLARRDGDPVIGGLGLSYGGGFQLIGACIDDRFDALVPTATWYDLGYSLAPDNVVKTAWGAALVALGVPTSGVRLDPLLYRALAEGLASTLTGRGLSQTVRDRLYNSSPASFYDGHIARDGQREPCETRRTPKVDVLLVQGVGDTLFNLNEAAANAKALRAAGNDVHLIAMQYGHSLPFLQDIDRIAYRTDASLRIDDEYVETAVLELAYLDWKLKGVTPTQSVPRNMIVLDDETSLFFDELPVGTGEHGPTVEFAGDATTGGLDLLLGIVRRQSVSRLWSLATGTAGNAWTALKRVFDHDKPASGDETALVARLINALPSDHLDELASGGTFIELMTIEAENQAIAGIPQIEIDISGDDRDPIAFVGIGVQRAGLGATVLLNKQVRPIRGAGPRSLDLNGVSHRLHAGDRLGLLVYGYHPQYLASFSAIPGRIRVTGRIALPIVDVT